jgi:hypothetical protein
VTCSDPMRANANHEFTGRAHDVVARAAEKQRLGRLGRALHPDVEYIERAAGTSTLHGGDEVLPGLARR